MQDPRGWQLTHVTVHVFHAVALDINLSREQRLKMNSVDDLEMSHSTVRALPC